MSTDAQFVAQARADAIKNGMSPDVADQFVRQLGRPPAPEMHRHPGALTRANASAAPKTDQLAADFNRLKLPAALLTRARAEGLPDKTITACLNDCPRKGVPLEVALAARLMQAIAADFAARFWKGAQ